MANQNEVCFLQALSQSIKKIRTKEGMRLFAYFIKSMKMTKGFDQFSSAWGEMLKENGFTDEYNVLDAIEQKKKNAEDVRELASLDALR